MWKKLALVVVTVSVVSACARPIGAPAQDSLTYRQQGLNATSISAGACDDVGQFIPGGGELRLEASAAPAHD